MNEIRRLVVSGIVVGDLDIGVHHRDGVRILKGAEAVESTIDGGVLRVHPIDTSDGEPPTVSIEAGPLDRVSLVNGATLTLSGSLDHLDIEALGARPIDATGLRLKTARVELEQSSIAVLVTESVSGYSAYGSKLIVSGGPDLSKVFTSNGGRIVVG